MMVRVEDSEHYKDLDERADVCGRIHVRDVACRIAYEICGVTDFAGGAKSQGDFERALAIIATQDGDEIAAFLAKLAKRPD